MVDKKDETIGNKPQYGPLALLVLSALCREREKNHRTAENMFGPLELQKAWNQIVHETMGELRNIFDENYNDPRPALSDDRVREIIRENGLKLIGEKRLKIVVDNI